MTWSTTATRSSRSVCRYAHCIPNSHPDQGAQLCHDIANGKFDSKLKALASYLAIFPNVKYIFRVDYEVSGNLHANTNPHAFDQRTWDLTAYPRAFQHVRGVIRGKVSNIAFMFHPVRGDAQLLYPGNDVVDYQGKVVTSVVDQTKANSNF